MRRTSRALTVLAVGIGLWAGAAAAEDIGIPLPKGAKVLPEPFDVTLGSTPLKVQGFSTAMTQEELRAFYEEALPQAGWRVSPLPWQARQAQVKDDLERAAQEQPEAAGDPAVQDFQQRVQRTHEALRRQLYASRGGEHVILNLTSVGSERVVFINRWQGAASWMEPASGEALGPLGASAGAWPATNICCAKESVNETDLGRVLPTTIPPYPGARILATNRTESGESRVVVLETTDAPEAVETFYRQQMAYNGWGEISEAGSASPNMLMYRSHTHLCGIVIGTSPQAREAGPGQPVTVVTINVMDRPSFGAETGL